VPEVGWWGGAWVPFAFRGRASLPKPFYTNFGVKLDDGFFFFFSSLSLGFSLLISYRKSLRCTWGPEEEHGCSKWLCAFVRSWRWGGEAWCDCVSEGVCMRQWLRVSEAMCVRQWLRVSEGCEAVCFCEAVRVRRLIVWAEMRD